MSFRTGRCSDPCGPSALGLREVGTSRLATKLSLSSAPAKHNEAALLDPWLALLLLLQRWMTQRNFIGSGCRRRDISDLFLAFRWIVLTSVRLVIGRVGCEYDCDRPFIHRYTFDSHVLVRRLGRYCSSDRPSELCNQLVRI